MVVLFIISLLSTDRARWAMGQNGKILKKHYRLQLILLGTFATANKMLKLASYFLHVPVFPIFFLCLHLKLT